MNEGADSHSNLSEWGCAPTRRRAIGGAIGWVDLLSIEWAIGGATGWVDLLSIEWARGGADLCGGVVWWWGGGLGMILVLPISDKKPQYNFVENHTTTRKNCDKSRNIRTVS